MKTNVDINDGSDNEAVKLERAGRLKGVDLRETPETRIAVKTGDAVDLLGKRFELFRPAQCLKAVSSPDSGCGSCDTKQNTLDSSLVAGSIFERQDDPFLYDVAGLATELHGQGGSLQFKYVSGSYFLHAPGVTLKAFKSKDLVRLTGNFAQAFVKDSEFNMLILQWGSFVDCDLSGAQIKLLILKADNIDAAGLKIPNTVGRVYFSWIAGCGGRGERGGKTADWNSGHLVRLKQ